MLDLRARSLPSSGPSHGRDVVVLAGGRGADFVLWVSSSERGEDAIVLGTGQGLRNTFDAPAPLRSRRDGAAPRPLALQR